MDTLNSPAVVAATAATLVALWGLPALLARVWPWQLIRGTDGKLSTSKLQFLIWTTVTVFAYVAFFIQRCADDTFAPIDSVPHNLLLAMGMSGVTAVTAKAITSNFVATGRVTKLSNGPGGVFSADDGGTDLSKVQLIAWTAVGVVVYLVTLGKSDVKSGLPDIDATLMVLMGLGHAAYIGKKLVTTDTPQLLTVTQQVRRAAPVVISGTSLGTQAGDVLIDHQVVSGLSLTWTDTAITFNLPARHPNGSSWLDGQSIVFEVNANGVGAANALKATVQVAPRPATLNPDRAKAGDTVHLLGELFAGSNVSVTVDGVAATIVSATDTDIAFVVPTVNANAAAILVTVDGISPPTGLALIIS